MRYVVIENPGTESRLVIKEAEIPQCAKEAILIKVRFAGLNRADLMQRQGLYPPPANESAILGLEVAGEVVSVGSAVSKFKEGDAVFGLVGSGAYAEYCSVHHSLASLIPHNWNFKLAAALPEALCAAHAALFLDGQLKANQQLLIHAAGSGISSLGIQMALLAQAKVIATVSSQKMEKAQSLGATRLINYQNEDFSKVIEESSLDLVVDFIGGEYLSKHLALLKPKGRLVQMACMQGAKAECNLALLMKKRIALIGFVLRGQTLKDKAKIWKSAEKRWWPSLCEKSLKPIIDSVYSLEEVEKAHQRMQNSEHFGKILLRMN